MITVNVFSPQNLLCLMLANKISCAMGHSIITTEHFYLANMLGHKNNSNALIFYNHIVARYGTSTPVKRINFFEVITPALWRSLNKYGHTSSFLVCDDILDNEKNGATQIWKKMTGEA